MHIHISLHPLIDVDVSGGEISLAETLTPLNNIWLRRAETVPIRLMKLAVHERMFMSPK